MSGSLEPSPSREQESPSRGRNHSWHRTRSRSLARRRERSEPQGESLEHLVRRVFAHALHLFIDKDDKNQTRKPPEGSDSDRAGERRLSRDQLETNDIARVILCQVLKYAVRHYMEKRRQSERMPGPEREGRGRPLQRGRERRGEDAINLRPPLEAPPPLPPQPQRPPQEPTPPSSPRGQPPVHSPHHAAHQPPLTHRHHHPQPTSRALPIHPIPLRRPLSEYSQEESARLSTALDDLILQLLRTDDLIYQTWHRPVVDRLDTRRAVHTHADDLQRSITRAIIRARTVRDILRGFPERRVRISEHTWRSD